MNFFELHAEQNELRSQIQALVSGAEVEKRSFNTEEQTQIDSLSAKIKAIDIKIDEERSKPITKPIVEITQGEPVMENRSFAEVVQEKRAITTGSGNLVAVDINKDFIKKVTESNFVRSDAKALTIVGKDRVPYIASVGAATILAENGTVTPSAETTASVNFEAFDLFKQVPISKAMMNNTFTNTEAMIDDSASAALTEGELGYFVYGTGTGEPQGLAVGGTLRAAIASATALTLAELKALLASLKPKYRAGAKLYVAADFESVLDGVVAEAGSGKPAYNREASTVFGIPVVITEWLDKTTHKKPIVYANLSKGYAVAQRGSGVDRNIFEDAPNSKYGANYSEYIDGRVLIAEAIQVLQTP